MSLNCQEINTILDEMNLTGSFIQNIVQPGFDTLALYTYKEGVSKTVLICLAPGACRINQTNKKIPRNDKPLRFNEFMKSKIKGCRINSCMQLGHERIIKMELSHNDENFFLYIRLWSGASNIIVTDEQSKILDVFFRRPKKDEVTGGTFVEPEIREDQKTFLVRTFKEYNLPNFENLSFNEKVEIWYSEHSETLSKEALLEQAQKIYNQRKTKMESALERLCEKKESFLHAEQWKHQGDLILAFGHLIDGESKFLECIDYETDSPISIQIDPKKRVQENASIYYEKYKKAVSGLEELEYDIQKAKKDLLDLDSTYEAILKEPNPIRIQQLIRKQTKPKQQIVKKHPGLSYQLGPWYILAGRTASENDELLRHHVRGQDMWLHVRDFSGGYVFIKNIPGKTIPLDVLLNAANIAVYHSKARKAGKADLYYTHVKYLRRAKNGPKGTVLPTHEKNLSVTLDNQRLKTMEEALLDN